MAARGKKAEAHAPINHRERERSLIAVMIRMLHAYGALNMRGGHLTYAHKRVRHNIALVFKLRRVIHVQQIASAAACEGGAARLPPVLAWNLHGGKLAYGII